MRVSIKFVEMQKPELRERIAILSAGEIKEELDSRAVVQYIN